MLSRISILAPAPVQRAAADGAQGPSGPEVHGIATAGFHGESRRLPGLERLQPLFGHHDLSGVRAYTGQGAVTAARQLGAKAYTAGNQIGFDGPSPSLHIVAHEAAHVVQQRAGVHLKSGIGEVGDAYEQQAEAVGRAVSRGESVESLLDRSIGPPSACSPATPSTRAVQMYTVLDNKPTKLSENGQLVVQGNKVQDGFYATPDKIKESNAKLAAVGSFVRFMTREESFGKGIVSNDESWSPHAKRIKINEQPLYQVLPRWEAKPDQKPYMNLVGFHGVSHTNLNKHNRSISDRNVQQGAKNWSTMELWYDCGRSSSAVMGSPTGQRSGLYKNLTTNKLSETSMGEADSITAPIHQQMPEFLKKNPQYIVPGKHFPKGPNGKIKWFQNMSSRRELLAAYWAMSEQGRRAFDEAVGANSAALPDVGQGYSMRTEVNAPDFEHANQKQNTYEFHWAGVVARDGKDTVTLEAEANSDNPFAKHTKSWSFNMYGPTYEQSFMKEHLATTQHGNRASVVVTQVPKDKINTHFEYDEEPLHKMDNTALLTEEEKLQHAAQRNNGAPMPNAPIPNAPIPNAPIPNAPILNAPIPNAPMPKIPIAPKPMAPQPDASLKLPSPPNNSVSSVPNGPLAPNLINLPKKPNYKEQKLAEAAQLRRKQQQEKQLKEARRQVAPHRRLLAQAYLGDIIHEAAVNNLRRAAPPKKLRYFVDDSALLLGHRRKKVPSNKKPSDFQSSSQQVKVDSIDSQSSLNDKNPLDSQSSSQQVKVDSGDSQSSLSDNGPSMGSRMYVDWAPLEPAFTAIGLSHKLAFSYTPLDIVRLGNQRLLRYTFKINLEQATYLYHAARKWVL